MDSAPASAKSRLSGLTKLVPQFLRFGAVGAMGFVVDYTVVTALNAPFGPFWAGYLAFPVAASVTWALNRMWTFRGQGSGPMHRQWAKFLAANMLGFLLNRGTYTLTILFIPFAATHLVIALFAGLLAGMFINFYLSRSIVFRS